MCERFGRLSSPLRLHGASEFFSWVRHGTPSLEGGVGEVIWRGGGGRSCGKNVLGGKEVSLRSNVGKYVGAWDSHAISLLSLIFF